MSQLPTVRITDNDEPNRLSNLIRQSEAMSPLEHFQAQQAAQQNARQWARRDEQSKEKIAAIFRNAAR
jgi:hypothetical protein